MKPRLEPCDHTEEDRAILCKSYRGLAVMQDRRDADLMLALVHYRDQYMFEYPNCIRYAAHLAMRVAEIHGRDMGDTFNFP